MEKEILEKILDKMEKIEDNLTLILFSISVIIGILIGRGCN
jgi:hypothetical protein